MKLLRFVLFNLLFFSVTSIDFGNADLKKIIKTNSFENIKQLIKHYPKLFSRKEYDEAIIEAAKNKDRKLYELLETYASRHAHSQAYDILLERKSNFRFHEISEI